MSNSGFTPGPWELCDLGDYADFDGMSRVIVADDRRLAVVHVSDEETDANACLISAAPELLEALTNLVGLAKMGAARLDKYHAALADAQAAIDKARGA